MLYTESKYAADKVAGMVAEKAASLKANRGLSDLLGYGIGVVSRRLAANPLRYRDYGPYWWGVKRLLNDAEHAVGDEFDPVVASEYSGSNGAETLVMAEMFRDENIATRPIGSNVFTIAEGVDYILFDKDMEERAQK